MPSISFRRATNKEYGRLRDAPNYGTDLLDHCKIEHVASDQRRMQKQLKIINTERLTEGTKF